MSIRKGTSSINREAATYVKYEDEFRTFSAAAYACASTDYDVPVPSGTMQLYCYLLQTNAGVDVSDSYCSLLIKTTERLMRDVFIVAVAYPGHVAATCNFGHISRLLRTYVEYADQQSQAYAHITASAPSKIYSTFCSNGGSAYCFADRDYDLWRLQPDDYGYFTLRAYACFLLGMVHSPPAEEE